MPLLPDQTPTGGFVEPGFHVGVDVPGGGEVGGVARGIVDLDPGERPPALVVVEAVEEAAGVFANVWLRDGEGAAKG